ncbi:PcfJ domain-containing protein [Paenibacillus alvei]|uniref:PcfJ domain-containing protein n=1 Tax=Paenibacillus alvei TaxID=44250 RepID=UPI002280E660|nr:PcfJ domain-containing protein [Paenibacillus alvei]MCY9733133.1 PcfJ domain-containing protein [Paenibacillus alvei]
MSLGIPKDFTDHMPQQISEELNSYVIEEALGDSRYIFTRRAGSFQYGYCTHCKNEYSTKGFRHGKTEMCPKCGSFCTVKASGRGRKKLIDDAYIVWYDKSRKDSKSIVAHGIYIQRDYSGDYKQVETQFYVQAEYVFTPGDPKAAGKDRFGTARMVRRDYYQNFYETSSIFSERDSVMRRPPFYMSEDNISTAVQGTPFQYSGWEEFISYRLFDEWVGGLFGTTRREGEPRTDLVKFFEVAAKYPCTEYLVKMGFSSFIERKINGSGTYGAIHWRGTSMDKVLRLSKTEIKELRALNIKVTPLHLHSYNFYKKRGLPMSFEKAYELRELTHSDSWKILKQLELPFELSVKYIYKQFSRPGASKHYYDVSSVLRDWRDYLGDCKKLGMDTGSNAVLYPNNLHTAHQKTIKKVKYAEDQALNLRVIDRYKKLNSQYRFESNGLIIRPAANSAELVQEGKQLSHCVGGYAKNYADGKCDLLFIRRVSEPGKPFYTVEVRGGKVVQCRGFKNAAMTAEVKAFVERFIDEKLTKKKRIKAIQGVAV